MKHKIIINNGNKEKTLPYVIDLIERAVVQTDILVELSRPKRSLDQNALLWAVLTDIARQAELVINGQSMKASPEDWKAVFTSALRQYERMALGIDGGLVMLGHPTRRMTKAEFSDLLELIFAYCSENGIKIKDRKYDIYFK